MSLFSPLYKFRLMEIIAGKLQAIGEIKDIGEIELPVFPPLYQSQTLLFPSGPKMMQLPIKDSQSITLIHDGFVFLPIGIQIDTAKKETALYVQRLGPADKVEIMGRQPAKAPLAKV